jgi:hypothetical protein
MKPHRTRNSTVFFSMTAFLLFFICGQLATYSESGAYQHSNHTGRKIETILSKTAQVRETPALDAFSPATFSNVHVDTIDGVIFSNATDKSTYLQKDTIRIRYIIKNHSMGTVVYDFSTPCLLEVQIASSNGKIIFSSLATEPCSRLESSKIILSPSAEKVIETYIAPLLKLKTSDMLTIRVQMTGYPLSTIPVTVACQTFSKPETPIALEGNSGYKPTVEFNSETKMLIIRVLRAQRLTISAFIFTGKKVNKLSCEKFLAPGTHLISFKNRKLSNGIVIFKVEGNGFSETKTINLSR